MNDSTPSAPLEYDLFISYSQADRGWVEGYLLDALAAANVRVVSELNFSLGAPRLVEFERALKQSKRTLLVLTPAYVAESALQFVELLVIHFGLESGTWPVIPLVLEEVELPPRLAFLVSLDATQVESWPDVVARLCQAVQARPPGQAIRPPCPYPGMRAFRQEEAAHFYGREAEVDELTQRLRLHPFAAVIGPSGSGKSSLVLAGLMPALPRSALFGSGAWLTRIIRPGDHPLAALSAGLGAESLDRFTPGALLAQENAARLLVVIDQFEEVFTQGEAGRSDFFSAIQRLISLRDCYVVITVRSDFFTDLLTSSLWPTIDAHRLEIAPLGVSGMRAAIVKPAEDMGVFIESALVERLVLGGAGQPGLLPFLQEVMARLWEKLERRYLPLRAYEALILPLAGYSGSERENIIAALALLADEVIHRLNPQEQTMARRIFLRLVQFGEGRPDTRRQQSVSALAAANDPPGQLDYILNYLADNRLIVLSGDETGERRVDLAHEAMLTGWPKLANWVKEGKEAEKTRRRLEDRAAEWVRLGRKGGLLDGQQLDEIDEWQRASAPLGIGCSDELGQFIAKSRSVLRKRYSVRVFLLGLLFILSIFVITNAVRRWWINRDWEPVVGLQQVSVKALAASATEMTAGSSGYGVAQFRGDAWTPWQANGIPTGQEGKVLETADANVDAVLALAYDPLRPEDLYAWIEGEGVFRLDRNTMTWERVAPGGPVLTYASLPLAISNGSIIAIADDLGIHVWNTNSQEWSHLSEATFSLDQEFKSVITDKNGTPFLAGQRGVLRGSGDPPWTWDLLHPLADGQALAVGYDGSIFVSTSGRGGANIVCLSANGTQIQPPYRVPVTNWLMQAAGVLIPAFSGEAQTRMIVAHPGLADRFFMTTNQGALYSLTCTGDRQYLGQTSFIQAVSSSLAVWKEDEQGVVLVWGTLGGLTQRRLPSER